MRTLFALATGLALSLSTAAYAEMTTADAQRMATPAATIAVAANQQQKVTCHHFVHEGSLTPVVECADQTTWTKRRIDVQQQLWKIQVRSFSRPM
ncbi:MAG TPA: hypothetical protein VG889_06280 [Rhizomicrobium sp.]|nr:hypothetical protein [Rhizomicrobium sp.]